MRNVIFAINYKIIHEFAIHLDEEDVPGFIQC